MKAREALDGLAERHGILRVFRDLDGNNKPTNQDTIKALLQADGVICDNDAAIVEAFEAELDAQNARFHPREIIIPARQPYQISLAGPTSWQLDFEGAPELTEIGRAQTHIDLPPMPSGVHNLKIGPENITIIAAPKQAPSLHNLIGRSRIWGVTGALYGLRSEQNFGVGDFRDLADVAKGSSESGASFFGINPVHALGLHDDQTISPYSPTHRGFLNALHICLAEIPGLNGSTRAAQLVEHERQTAVQDGAFIDYRRFRQVVLPLMERLFEVFGEEASETVKSDFNSFCQVSGQALDDFALFEALTEIHGPDWRDWPSGLQSVTGADVGVWRAKLMQPTQFYKWLQWVADTQLSGAQDAAKVGGRGLGLYLDLAVGPRRGGAETWCQGASIAENVSVGAPPDSLTPAGQNWNIAAFAPSKLSATRYSAFRQILRSTMRAAGIIRIDHVLGLNRSFWIPDNGAPGGYIRQPFQSLLAIIAIEAERAQTAVIGEDLGLVPPGFRETTRGRGLYSYSVLQYEKDDTGTFRRPDDLRPYSLACFATHDTPTLEGFKQGVDIGWWRELGWADFETANRARRERAKDVMRLTDLGGDPDLFRSVHGALAGSPVEMVNIQLDDLMGEDEAQNLPGTIDEHPNWRRRAPVSVQDIKTLPAFKDISSLMTQSGRSVLPARKETANDTA